ncbi:unnamed protein product [Soboliphyme baturini]|uniref:Secreted protein n=1 Tax=Soboliphyme baturini TaxID=241478 RepID=A0A183IE15_9BILA|nr:unnamed protein product [Soboliphyme baturini]
MRGCNCVACLTTVGVCRSLSSASQSKYDELKAQKDQGSKQQGDRGDGVPGCELSDGRIRPPAIVCRSAILRQSETNQAKRQIHPPSLPRRRHFTRAISWMIGRHATKD